MANSVKRLVEVCSKEDGFLGSYFEAKLVQRVSKDKFLVEFLTLVSEEEDENEKLREVVDATEVRPCPPEIAVAEFDVMEKVDAYDRDGWWVGRLAGKECGKISTLCTLTGPEMSLFIPGHLLRVIKNGRRTLGSPHWSSHQDSIDP
ncbi:hypothetical protein CUMW_260490 [Citrus unshiu]|uniref:Agenet domain-containing protein n=1 Tax=Citrus unshiu TaxID=55188 RepID=A0A2H5QTN5_CITUN|nr:hypothetical protein CUMW_260490 [Citrus unshiu]